MKMKFCVPWWHMEPIIITFFIIWEIFLQVLLTDFNHVFNQFDIWLYIMLINNNMLPNISLIAKTFNLFNKLGNFLFGVFFIFKIITFNSRSQPMNITYMPYWWTLIVLSCSLFFIFKNATYMIYVNSWAFYILFDDFAKYALKQTIFGTTLSLSTRSWFFIQVELRKAILKYFSFFKCPVMWRFCI